MKKAGIFVIILGISLTIFTVLAFSSREVAADPVNVEKTHNKPYINSWSPSVGLIVIAVGFLIFFIPKKKQITW
jgi:hypothetical protein